MRRALQRVAYAVDLQQRVCLRIVRLTELLGVSVVQLDLECHLCNLLDDRSKCRCQNQTHCSLHEGPHGFRSQQPAPQTAETAAAAATQHERKARHAFIKVESVLIPFGVRIAPTERVICRTTSSRRPRSAIFRFVFGQSDTCQRSEAPTVPSKTHHPLACFRSVTGLDTIDAEDRYIPDSWDQLKRT